MSPPLPFLPAAIRRLYRGGWVVGLKHSSFMISRMFAIALFQAVVDRESVASPDAVELDHEELAMVVALVRVRL